jgi:hypothetical protein
VLRNHVNLGLGFQRILDLQQQRILDLQPKDKMRADLTRKHKGGGEKKRWTSMTANWLLNSYQRRCSVNRAPVCHWGLLSSGQIEESATHPLSDQHAAEEDGWMDRWGMDGGMDG